MTRVSYFLCIFRYSKVISSDKIRQFVANVSNSFLCKLSQEEDGIY